jgi:hypothetical protein
MSTEPAGPGRSGHEESQDATIEELAKLTFHKPRNVPVAFTLAGQERFQVPGDDSVHRVVFRIARPVCDVDSHEGIGGCKLRRNASGNSISEIQGVHNGKVRLQRDNRVALVMTLPTLKLISRLRHGIPGRTSPYIAARLFRLSEA